MTNNIVASTINTASASTTSNNVPSSSSKYKISANDFKFERLIGEGSYSTVSFMVKIMNYSSLLIHRCFFTPHR